MKLMILREIRIEKNGGKDEREMRLTFKMFFMFHLSDSLVYSRSLEACSRSILSLGEPAGGVLR